MRKSIQFPYYSIFTWLLLFIVSTNLSAQGNSDNSAPSILNVMATSKSVCPTSTINISFTLQNGNGSSNSGAYFTTATKFIISLIYLNPLGDSVLVNSGNVFSLSASEIPPGTNEATSSPINRTYTIPINTITRTDYRIEISSNTPIISGSDLSRSTPFTISDNNYWSGAIDSDWNKAENWDCDLIPSYINNAIIKSGLTNYPKLYIGPEGLTKDIVIDANASLIVDNNVLNIKNSITNNGSLNSLTGTISMQGTTSQIIPANSFESNRIKNLIINNTSGVILNGTLEISGYILAQKGNLNINDELTLISDAFQTALIDGSGNGEIIGAIKMQRYLDNTLGYKYFSSPFNSSTVGDFTSFVDLTATFPQVYSYDENNESTNDEDISGWIPYTDAGNGLLTLEGYAFNFGNGGGAALVELNGTVNNGSFTKSLSNNNGKFTHGFNLVGNPYPSPINWDASGWTKTNVDDAIYFFSATDQYTGTYSSYVNGISSSGITSPGIIPSMQGFFVHVNDGNDPTTVTSGSLGISNAVRINDFFQPFYKKSKTPKSLIRIIANINGNNSNDAMVIYFDSFAKSEFEKDKDALKLMNIDQDVPNLSSLSKENKKLSINALPESAKNSTERIPLVVKNDIDGELNIQLKDIENLSSNFNVYLIDDVNHTGQNLSQKPKYKTQIKAGEHNSRFFLIFSESQLTDAAIAFDEPFSIKTVNGQVLVKINLKDYEKGVLKATTVTGQILESKEAKGSETIHLNGIKSSGLYIINLSWNNQQFSKKIILQK